MKLTKHAWSLWGCSLAAVLAAALLIPFRKTGVYWLALACLPLMFALCALVFVRAFREKDTLESKLLGWPLFKVAFFAVAGEICLALLLMAFSTLCPLWLGALLEILLFAAAGVCLVVRDAAVQATVQSESTLIDTAAGWKALRARVNALSAGSNHAGLKKLAEEMRFADPTPCSLDGEMEDYIRRLEQEMQEEDVEKLLTLLNRRKSLVKAEKKSK